MIFIPDSYHSMWCEFDNAIVEGGKKASLILRTACYNLDFGPFEGAAFWQQQKDAVWDLV